MSKQKDDISQIKKYLGGKLDNRAMHELERRALDDPFLADAMEGYEHNGKDQQKNIADLSGRLQSRTDKKVRSITPWMQLSAAASLLLIISFGAWLLLRKPAEPNNKIAAVVQANKPEQPTLSAPTTAAPQSAPDTVAAFAKRADADNQPKAFSDAATAPAKEKSYGGVTAVKKDTTNNLASVNVTQAPPAVPQPISAAADQARFKSQGTQQANEAIVQDINKKSSATIAKKPLQPNPETLLQAHVDGVDVQPAHKNITGYVIGTDGGQPLVGAVVRLAGANFGVVTDANGKFVMHDVPEKKNLVVGYIGYETKQVKVNNADSVSISLQPSGAQLSEVVITNPSADQNKSTSSTDAHPSAGWKALTAYLDKNAISPDGQTGKVRLSFMVDGKGALSNFKITKSLSTAADQKAIDLITNGPAWAGNIDGQPHEVKVTVKFH